MRRAARAPAARPVPATRAPLRADRTGRRATGASSYCSARVRSLRLADGATVWRAMWRRVGALARAWVAGEWFGERGQRLPVGPLLIHGALAAVLCATVR